MNEEERLLIGSILSGIYVHPTLEDDHVSCNIRFKKRTKLSLNAKEFQPEFDTTSVQETNETPFADDPDHPHRTKSKHLSHNFGQPLRLPVYPPSLSPRKHPTMQPISGPSPLLQFSSHPSIPDERNIPDMRFPDDLAFKQDLDLMCGNQKASRNLQKIFDSGSYHQRLAIFCAVEKRMLQASKDQFGNYIVQKILQSGEDAWRTRLVVLMKGHIMELAKNQYGSRVLHRVLAAVHDTKYLESVLQELKAGIRQLAADPHGCYVLLQCFEILPLQLIEFAIPVIEELTLNMAHHTYGCRVLQHLLLRQSNRLILRKIMENAEKLCYCEFGNYLIQYLLRAGKESEIQQSVCKIVRANFEELALNKYGSNVAEVFLEVIGLEEQRRITLLMLRSLNGMPFYAILAMHPYGNFVFKKYLQLDLQIIVPVIKMMKEMPEVLAVISQSEYGQKVFHLIEKCLYYVDCNM